MPSARALASEFVEHLRRLNEEDRAAMACLRRSLSHEPGAYAPAYPYVEPFVGQDDRSDSPRRMALYVTAGLFAMHPVEETGVHYAQALAELMLEKESKSIEKRFIGLLESHPEDLHVHLRRATSLLAAERKGFDYTKLCRDLMRWYDIWRLTLSDRVRRKWARKFYSCLQSDQGEAGGSSTGESKLGRKHGKVR